MEIHTPLLIVLRNLHNESIINILINNKTDINQKNKNGDTPLLIALKYIMMKM